MDMPDSNDKDKMNEDDQAVWDDYVKDIQPVEEEEESFQALLDEADISDRQEKPLKRTTSKCTYQKDKDLKKSDIKPQGGALPAQLDRRTEEKLRKGKMPIEGRLDLHGMNQTQAHESLVRFVASCYDQGLRCVLVITGKGKSKSTSNDWLSPSKGILKENVPLWLEERPLKDIVLKFFKAQPKDGGSGALYIYIKRKR